MNTVMPPGESVISGAKKPSDRNLVRPDWETVPSHALASCRIFPIAPVTFFRLMTSLASARTRGVPVSLQSGAERRRRRRTFSLVHELKREVLSRSLLRATLLLYPISSAK